jgi:hypothetical protein
MTTQKKAVLKIRTAAAANELNAVEYIYSNQMVFLGRSSTHLVTFSKLYLVNL